MTFSLEAAEAVLSRPAPSPLEGQQAICVATIAHHVYEGPGACRAEDFATVCGKHRDAHQLVKDGQS